MYCNYAGGYCIIPQQIENGCEECEIREEILQKQKPFSNVHYVSFEIAREIANAFFGVASVISSSDFCFRATHGDVSLQILREINVPGQAYCRVIVLKKPVGYFNYDLKTGRKSPLWKED